MANVSFVVDDVAVERRLCGDKVAENNRREHALRAKFATGRQNETADRNDPCAMIGL